MSDDLKILMQKMSIWQKAAAELEGHVYVYGHNYFGFAVKVKLRGNANVERNFTKLCSKITKLFFKYFVDKENNYYLVVMYKVLKKNWK